MDICKQKMTKQESVVFSFLCIHAGMEFHVRALARELNASPTGISKSVKKLEKAGIIKSDRVFLLRVELNREKEEVIQMKRVENMRLLYQSGLVNFLSGKLVGTTIIVFGSFAFGEDTISPESDIDIAVVGSEEIKIKLNKYENKLKRQINLQFFQSFRKIERNLKDSVLNGIVLQGHVEL